MNEKLPAGRSSRLLKMVLLLLSGFGAGSNAQAQFTTGNVVVLQTGDGTAALTSASTALFLKEYNTVTAAQTAPVSTVSVPVSGVSRLTNSGSASSEGQITLSSDSLRIVIAGYDTTTGIASIASTTSASINRAVDTVSILGIPGRVAATATQFSGNNIRCATRNNGENYWAAGGTSGVYYLGNTANAAAIETSLASVKAVLAANGNLYYSSSSGTPALYKIAGQPVVATTPSTLITFASTESPYAFALNSAETMVYVADDRTTAGGGIQQWSYNTTTSTWTWVDTLSVGTAAGARGVTVDWSGTYPVVYAVTTDNRLVKIIDTNTSVTTYVTLATAPTNTAFRSVVFAPSCFAH